MPLKFYSLETSPYLEHLSDAGIKKPPPGMGGGSFEYILDSYKPYPSGPL